MGSSSKYKSFFGNAKRDLDVSASIKTSLTKLNNSILKLEQAVEAKKAAAATGKKQNTPAADLFTSMTASQQNPSNINDTNVRNLAARLDTAIHQVEQILKGGRG